MIYHDIAQGTDEWLGLRLKKFTASAFDDLLLSKTTAGYEKAIYKVAFERMFGISPEEPFKSAYMQRGNEIEPDAKNAYELETFEETKNGGFFEYNEWIGASPDGLVNDDGLVQIKCPAYNTQINYLIKGGFPTTYKWQIQGELFVTGRKWCDFYSYHPNLKPLRIRINRDETLINELNLKLQTAISEAMQIIEKLKNI